MLRCLFFIIIVVLVSSCAKPPHQELNATEYTVGRAYAMQASEFAPTEYKAARLALEDARKSMQRANYGAARESLGFSLKHARRSIVLTEEAKTRRIEAAAQRLRDEEEARQAAILQGWDEEENTFQAQTPTPPPTPKPVPKPKPKITPATSYTVGEKETLWTISAQSKVYNDGLLWPLLYQANRDQIKDPRQIFPGQSLNIRRDMTQKDLDEARQKAKESDIFPVSTKAPPKQ
ncbi:MAG: LysM peptidoglycan-binding domain-containing protein [Deltaproteobacteria bacterium]|nr:LysM peptidoglycan-binding domain-containing protein [Deltaproteobacteria bacterium]